MIPAQWIRAIGWALFVLGVYGTGAYLAAAEMAEGTDLTVGRLVQACLMLACAIVGYFMTERRDP